MKMVKHKKVDELLNKPVIINIGLKSFHEDNQEQNVTSVHVDWQPAAGGDKELEKMLKQIL